MARAKIRLSAKEVAEALGEKYGVKVTGLRPFWHVGEKDGVLTVHIEALDILCEPSPSEGFTALIARQAEAHKQNGVSKDTDSTDAGVGGEPARSGRAGQALPET